MTKTEFLKKAFDVAKKTNHIWPDMAACEAALESNYGISKLARDFNNLFGQKQSKATHNYPTVTLPTQEYVNNKFTPTVAHWVIFPDWYTCFSERMLLLNRVAQYKPALMAENADDYIVNVSKVWATDPLRAKKVKDIHESFLCLFC